MRTTLIFTATLLATAISASKLGIRQGATLPQGAGPRCTDAAGQNPGNLAGAGQGSQFATGCCLRDNDCQTQCCGRNTGICQNLGVANSAAVGGCGFGGAAGGNAPAPPAPPAPPAAPATPATPAGGAPAAGIPAGAGPRCTDVAGQNPGNLAGQGQGNQFATGCCFSDADCQTQCCGRNTGICQAQAVAAQPEVGGCGGTFGQQRLLIKF